jgi:DNA-binding NarL/FixJ family response regulator
VSAGVVPPLVVMGPQMVRLQLLRHNPRAAESAVASLAEHEGAGWPWYDATVRWCTGLYKDDGEMLRDAAIQLAAAERPLEAACALEAGGLAMLRHSRRRETLELWESAASGYERLGAAWDLSQLRRQCRRLGLKLPGRRLPAAPAAGWPSLTLTVDRVAGLVASGLSNPAIATVLGVSPRTVQTHVSHILAKLGLSSRVELAAAHARRDSSAAVQK